MKRIPAYTTRELLNHIDGLLDGPGSENIGVDTAAALEVWRNMFEDQDQYEKTDLFSFIDTLVTTAVENYTLDDPASQGQRATIQDAKEGNSSDQTDWYEQKYEMKMTGSSWITTYDWIKGAKFSAEQTLELLRRIYKKHFDHILRTEDLEPMKKKSDGFGLINHEIRAIETVDNILIEAANERHWNKDQLFAFVNSKDGRHCGDEISFVQNNPNRIKGTIITYINRFEQDQ